MSKMGRPLKEETNLSHSVNVRLDDEIYQKLCFYCDNSRQKGEVIREALRCFLGTENARRSNGRTERQ